MNEEKHRIAIVNPQKCKPKKCKQECKKGCPINKSQKLCINVMPSSPIVQISEVLCVGCGICVKACPFKAIKIVNIPKNMDKMTTHRYGKNSFKLHRLPVPRMGQVLGLVGVNGVGKTTALKILHTKLKPNLGNFVDPPQWQDILKHFKGSQLQTYLTKIMQNELKSTLKPQYVDDIPKFTKGQVRTLIMQSDAQGRAQQLIKTLEFQQLLERDLQELSGGELQRFALLMVMIRKADVYIFDQPSSYLDIKQRIKMARLIRETQTHNNYIIVVQHDLSILDYLSDFICCLYGQATAYGVVTAPFSVRLGINIFLSGFVPTENMRFREEELTFKMSDVFEEGALDKAGSYKYPQMKKVMGGFSLVVEAGGFRASQITVMLGENGTGKSTFIKMLYEAGKKKSKEDTEYPDLPQMNVSYKPQKLSPKFEGTVRQLLHSKVGDTWMTGNFMSEVAKPMKLDTIIDNEVQKLSGGELQRIAIILALAKGADIYLIDEPSAYLDSEQRVICAKMLKRFIINNHKTAFIVEHDFIMATYLADQVIVYEGKPGVECIANTPQGLLEGMNKFLNLLGVTFRRDPDNFRPRINKLNSVLDQQQKLAGNYFTLEE